MHVLPAHVTTRPCAAAALAGSFRYVPGSAGAGNRVYELRLRNASRTVCALAVRGVVLLGRAGRPLPTHATGAHTKTIRLAAGRELYASARFSPDVPGVGEQHPGACEPTAYRLRILLAHAKPVVAIVPPTAVCEHGAMSLSVFRSRIVRS